LTRILLIDDHSLFREAIARLLGRESDFEIVGECATVEEGISVLKSNPVDVVLLDINLGLQQGGAFLPLARQAEFKGKILVVTAGVSRLEAGLMNVARVSFSSGAPDQAYSGVTGATRSRRGSPPLPDAGLRERRPCRATRERQGWRFAGRPPIDAHAGCTSVESLLQQLFSKTGGARAPSWFTALSGIGKN
jgi:CheY-like chemotaxis protein